MVLDTRNSTISTLQTEVDNLILDLYPRQGEWAEEEYLDLTDHTNHLIEFTEFCEQTSRQLEEAP